MKIGVLKECKIPHDYRVPFTPEQLAQIQKSYDITCVIQPSPIRCFSDDEYRQAGIALQDDLSDCDVIFGVKEVPPDNLIEGKTYLFFAHVTKSQPHNQDLMGALIGKNITMIDYELLLGTNGIRAIGFGREAGIVGAYNALKIYGDKTGDFNLPLAHTLSGLDALYSRVYDLQNLRLRIMSTGAGGRVSGGIASVLEKTNLTPLTPEDYLTNHQRGAYTLLSPRHYIKRAHSTPQNNTPIVEQDFFADPTPYISNFHPYAQQSNMYIAGHFWDNRACAFFSLAHIKDANQFPIDIISDISCDIVGDGLAPIPTTVRECTLDDIAYDIDRTTGVEKPALSGANAITVTAVDNLPSAIPRDASQNFGTGLMNTVIPSILNQGNSSITDATICQGGQLTPKYSYLSAYAGL